MNEGVKIKVCGMRDIENIKQLAQCQIDYMGFIFYSKSPRYINTPFQAEIPNRIKKTGVFVNEDLGKIKETIDTFDLDAVQLHGNESTESCLFLKDTGLEIIKAFGIDDSFKWSSLLDYLGVVDYFLFDTKSSAHGGTGKTFNWETLVNYPYSTPYFLSGGLALENITEALKLKDERLYALDLNSKFEIEPGLKDIKQLTQAISIIHHEQISGRQ